MLKGIGDISCQLRYVSGSHDFRWKRVLYVFKYHLLLRGLDTGKMFLHSEVKI